jgi:hypothetical protein
LECWAEPSSGSKRKPSCLRNEGTYARHCSAVRFAVSIIEPPTWRTQC